jgi:hypothetical protein
MKIPEILKTVLIVVAVMFAVSMFDRARKTAGKKPLIFA